MKKIVLLLLISTVFTACKMYEKPEYKGIENIKFESLQDGIVYLTAEAKFFNPNQFGGQIEAIDIDVLIDDKNVAKVKELTETDIPTQSEFSIPLQMEIPLNQIIQNKGLWASIATVVAKQEVEIQMKGTITFDFQLFKHSFDIDEAKIVELKL